MPLLNSSEKFGKPFKRGVELASFGEVKLKKECEG